jgi:hypothetical protein
MPGLSTAHVTCMAVRKTTPRRNGIRARPVRRSMMMLVAALIVTGGAFTSKHALDQRLASTLPAVERISVADLFIDSTPVKVRLTEAWQRVDAVTTRTALRSDWTLWRRMHIQNWDVVSADMREEALDAMLEQYRHLLANPVVWNAMNAHDWDLVPQPVRALAFTHMLEYWAAWYDIGPRYGIAADVMAETLASIVMTESWFEHRAAHVNPWGNHDLGVAQASDGARERLRELYYDGRVDVLLEDEEYFDPWKGTRFVALWMRELLDQVNGDLPTAIRAYHRGLRRALVSGEGDDYLGLVRRRRQRYWRTQGASPAWRHLWERARELVDPLVPSGDRCAGFRASSSLHAASWVSDSAERRPRPPH